MARKNAGKKNDSFGGWELVNRTLTQDELKQFDKWAAEAYDDLEERVAIACGQGYKFSVNRHEDSDMWIISMVGKTTDTPNHKKTLTSWSHGLSEGILMCLYKSDVVFEGGTWYNSEGRRG